MIIYKITNQINNKSYIGKTIKTIDERFKTHLKNAKNKINRRLYDSMNFYGYENFLIEQIDIASSIEELNQKEIYYINLYDSIMPNGYNMTTGGDGGYTLEKWSDEDRRSLYEQQAKNRLWYKVTDETKELMKVSAIKREANKTASQKEIISNKISLTLKRKFASGELTTNLIHKSGKEHAGYIEIDIEQVCNLIKSQWKLIDIAEKFNCSKGVINQRLFERYKKTFAQLRKDYGIRGSYGKIKRIDVD